MKRTLQRIKDWIIIYKDNIINFILIVCLFGRYWLMRSTNWFVNFDSYYDGRLQIYNAIKLVTGNWLGDYDKFILCKNLSFPIFVAAICQLHLSYPAGFFGFICLSSFLFTRSIKPAIKSDFIRKIIFIIVLFNPVGLSFQAANFYRNAIQPWAVLIVISCLIAIYLRKFEKVNFKLFLWPLIGMFFTGFYWNLREDSIWLLPFILVASIITIVHFIIKTKKIKQSIIFSFIVFMPLIGIVLWNNIISGINYKYYGIYATNDRTHTYSSKVLGQLIRIDDGSNSGSNVWVTNESVELAKNASPTFAKLNLKVFKLWPTGGDFSIWALRDSAAESGYFKDAKSTNEVYKKIYEELKSAFESGKLKKREGIQLSDTSGIYKTEDLFYNFITSYKLSIRHIKYDEYRVKELEPIHNAHDEGDFALYENILGIRLRRTEPQLDEINSDFTLKLQNDNVIKSLHHNMFLVNIITNIYNFFSPVFFVFAIIGLFILGIDIFKNKKVDTCNLEIFIILIGLLLLCFCSSYLIGIWATSFNLESVNDNIYLSYTTAQTLIICCFEIIGMVILLKKCLEKYKTKKAHKAL